MNVPAPAQIADWLVLRLAVRLVVLFLTPPGSLP
jgi:hypothetical protein